MNLLKISLISLNFFMIKNLRSNSNNELEIKLGPNMKYNIFGILSMFQSLAVTKVFFAKATIAFYLVEQFYSKEHI